MSIDLAKYSCFIGWVARTRNESYDLKLLKVKWNIEKFHMGFNKY